MWVYRTEWKLPAKATCEHCVLQFEYMTGSRCWPPCLPDSKDCIESTCGAGGAGNDGGGEAVSPVSNLVIPSCPI